MASTTKPAGNKPLSSMEKISDEIFLHRPSATDSGDSAQPKLIIVAGWTNALDAHVAKYIEKYKTLYPSSQILFIKSTSKILFNPPLLNKAVQPLVPAIRACLPAEASPSPNPKLLIHMFSNGGSSSISNLYDAYASSARDGEDSHLPQHVTIFDSCPGVSTLGGFVAFAQVGLAGIQRLVATPLIYIVGFFWATAISAGFLTDWISVWGKTHNDTSDKNVNETRRTYIYSEPDTLVQFEAIEAHADEAEKKGVPVRREKFDGSAHASHARKDEARYWEIVSQTWDGKYR